MKRVNSAALVVFVTFLFFSCEKEEPIVITTSDFEVTIEENPEQGSVLGKVEGSTNRGSISFSIISSSPEAAFEIDVETGQLTVKNATLFDFETNPTLTAVVSVANGDMVENSNITVILTNITTTIAVSDIAITTPENPENGQIIHVIEAEVIEGSSSTYSIVSQTPEGAFDINNQTGELFVANELLFDYEVNTELTVVISVENEQSSAQANVLVSLIDVETIITTTNLTVSIDENPDEGMLLGLIETTASEGSVERAGLKYSITSESITGAFIIDENTGALTVKTPTLFDFEERITLTAIVLIAVDNTSATANVEISLNDVSTTITSADLIFTIDENPEKNYTLGIVEATGAEGSIAQNSLVYSISSASPAGAFSLDAVTGELIIVKPELVDYEANPTLTAVVAITNGNSSININVTVNLNDIEDISFSQVEFNGEYFRRLEGHQTVVFNGKLWVIGGFENSGLFPKYTGDVWSSSDGATWELVVSESIDTFRRRYMHEVVVFNDKMWVIGGRNDNGVLNDIWSSPDGLNWTEETVTGDEFLPSNFEHRVTVYDNKLWVVAGNSNNDIWRSTDGAFWEKMPYSYPRFSTRNYHELVVHNNKIWIIGGFIVGGGANDLWTSTDGIDWTEETVVGTHFSPRFKFQAQVFENKIWVSGGIGVNDMWTSPDGLTWKQESLSGEIFTRSEGDQMVVFNNKLWIVTNGKDRINEVWVMD